MHRSRRRTSPGVEVKRLPLLVSIEDLLEVSMGEERASSKKEMGSLTGEVLESGDELGLDLVGTELTDELRVVAVEEEGEEQLWFSERSGKSMERGETLD